MKLARKLTLMLLLGVLVVVAIYGYVDARHQVRQLEHTMADELSVLALSSSAAVSRLSQLGDPQSTARFLDDANRKTDNVELRWVRLGDPVGSPAGPTIALPALSGLRPGAELRATEDDRIFVYHRLAAPGSATAIEVSQPLVDVHAASQQIILRTLIAAGLIVALCALYASAVGMWLIARPVNRLVEHLHRLGEGDLSGRVRWTADDELGELAAELNDLTDRLREDRARLETEQAARLATVEQLRHADRLTTVGQLAAGVAHELGTPLNVVSGHAKMIATGDESQEEQAESARVIGEQAARMAAIIRQLLDFARRGKPKFGVSDLRPVVARTTRMLASAAQRKQVSLHYEEPAQPILIRMDEGQIQQVVTNMVVNAVQALPRGGTVTVTIDHARGAPPGDGDARDCIRLAIADEGEGIPAENLGRLFEPFFTTKGVGEGTGLGLPVSYGIVQEHGGWIDVQSELGKGTRFAIFLPVDVRADVSALGTGAAHP